MIVGSADRVQGIHDRGGESGRIGLGTDRPREARGAGGALVPQSVDQGSEGHRVIGGLDVVGGASRADLLDQDVAGTLKGGGRMRSGLWLDDVIARGSHRRPCRGARRLIAAVVERPLELRADPLLPEGRGASWVPAEGVEKCRRRGPVRPVLRARNGNGIRHLAAQRRPVGERPTRQQPALAVPVEGDRAPGHLPHTTDRIDHVLGAGLYVGERLVRQLYVADRIAGIAHRLPEVHRRHPLLLAATSGAVDEQHRFALGVASRRLAMKSGVELGRAGLQRRVLCAGRRREQQVCHPGDGEAETGEAARPIVVSTHDSRPYDGPGRG